MELEIGKTDLWCVSSCLGPIYDGPAWRPKAIGLAARSACGEGQQEQ